METIEKLLDLFSGFSEDQQREELEQLLLTLQEKGTDLERLRDFWNNGGVRQR